MKHAFDKPPVFLDRDGTIIVDKHYLSDPDQVELETGAAEGLAALSAQGFPLVVVSNQSGIGRGLFEEEAAHRVNARIDDMLRPYGVRILAWYLCPHAPGQECRCRKPLPGMALAAAQDWALELRGCYVIGDKRIDLELADAIGGTGILVTTGHGVEDQPWAEASGRLVVGRLEDAAAYILRREGLGAP